MSFNLENYTAVGFRRDEILPLLERGGLVAAGDIENDSTDGDRGQESSNNYPEWKRVLAVMHDLPFDKAVDSFAGIDPYDDRYLSDDESKARRLYGDMLAYAIECGELTDIRRTVDGKANVACIKLLDLHAWCARKGQIYPLPPPTGPVPSSQIGDITAVNWQALADGEDDQPRQAGDAVMIDLDTVPLELRIAINAYQTIENNPSLVAGRSARQAILQWLDDNHPSLTNKAKGRIATVANPAPEGGAPKTPDRTEPPTL